MANTDYYDLLGLKKGATDAEIKSAYRKKAMEWHPDMHKGADKESAEKKFKEVNEAYQVLSDSQKKAAYDQYGSAAFAQGGRGGGNPFAGGGNPFGSQGGPFTYTYQTNGQSPFGNADFGDPFDIFEQFFGGGGFGQRTQAKPRYGITIEFMEAVKGVEKEASIDGKKRKLKIPAGVSDGTRIRFDTFDLIVSVAPDKIFERDGNDIYVSVRIPFSIATLGGEIRVPTVDGDLKLKVRAGTQPGTMMRLRERGVKHVQGRGRGDEYVKIIIAVPEKLNSSQKRLFEELKREGL
jgi:DnaJ-class molecular chaperone